MTERRTIAGQPWYGRMTARDTGEAHRVATALELFFDLCFVVAVAQAGSRLHHALVEGHTWAGVTGYLLVFFSIWWAWMGFSWFASAYDVDDVPYRVCVLVQITGALILAAGIPRAFDRLDIGVVFVGYAVMRIGLDALRLRAAHADAARRTTMLRYASGEIACMVGWAVLLFALPARWLLPGWVAMAVVEMLVPLWAERASRTPWHPHHIAERYGLFTIIVLGESVLAATLAVQSALDAHAGFGDLASIAVGGLLTVFAMWWLYFAKPAYRFLASTKVAFLWGYGHYLIFVSAAAVGVGLAVDVDQAVGHAMLGTTAQAAVTIPVAVFLCVLWLLHIRPHRVDALYTLLFPAGAVLVLASTFTGASVLLTGLIMAALVGITVALAARAE